MRGVGGKPGWFWLFVIMGVFSVLAGFVLALLLPDSVHKPTPWLLPRLRYFTERELYILKHRVILDDPAKAGGPIKIGRKELVSAVSSTEDGYSMTTWLIIGLQLSNWRLWPHVLITLCNNGPLTAFGACEYTSSENLHAVGTDRQTDAPTIINSFGFQRLRSNALASIGPWILIPVSVTFSWFSDRL